MGEPNQIARFLQQRHDGRPIMKPRAQPVRRRTRDIKPIPPVGPSGDTEVRPIKRKTARDYDPGVPPVRRNPWQDEGEGEPETNG
jgi:hypothetical protein